MATRKVVPAAIRMHVKCRSSTQALEYFPPTSVFRQLVPDDKVLWSATWPEYIPKDYTSPIVLSGPVWADPTVRDSLKFNELDGSVDRRSHTGEYQLDTDQAPLNPCGRTGLKGRGILGKWGPNHAADPIVTRWKRGDGDAILSHSTSNKPVLQFVAVQRKDNGLWALPGGMIDAGDNVNITLKKEFSEEAMNSLEMSAEQLEKVKQQVDQAFTNGVEIYRGYVDDPRNTDNSWMETIACNFHDEDGSSVGAFTLHAGDDAAGVRWVDADGDLQLHANHSDFVKKTAELHKAHW